MRFTFHAGPVCSKRDFTQVVLPARSILETNSTAVNIFFSLSLPSSGVYMKYKMQDKSYMMQQLTRIKAKVRSVFSLSAVSSRMAFSVVHEPEAFVSLGLMLTTSCTICKSIKQIQNGSE